MTAPGDALRPLPCPHCGEAPTVHECDWSEPPTWSVLCGCTGCTHETAASAIAAWNVRTRPSPPTLARGEVTEEMVERAAEGMQDFNAEAQAIECVAHGYAVPDDTQFKKWADLDEHERVYVRNVARAALAAAAGDGEG